MTDKPTLDDIWDKLSAQHVCMLLDQSGTGALSVAARPMTPLVRKDENLIWFVTDRETGVAGLGDDSPVMLLFQDAGANDYLVVEGSAAVIEDRAKAKDLWSPMMKDFLDGPDDPRLVLLAVSPRACDYWTGPGRLIGGAKMLFTAATGVKTDLGTQGRISM